jgi:diguanylate cyclase (GGDEF)-like protein
MERALYWLRSVVARLWRIAALGVLGAALVFARRKGWLTGSLHAGHSGVAVALGAVLAVVGIAVAAGRTRAKTETDAKARNAVLAECELGAALAVSTYGLLVLCGGQPALHPLVYLLAAFAWTLLSRPAAIAVLVISAVLEMLLAWAGGASMVVASLQVVFLGAFAAAHAAFLRGQAIMLRRRHAEMLTSAVKSMRDEARDFRLIGSSLGAESRTRRRDEEEEKLAQGAVDTIHQSLYFTVELLKRTLDLHTCVLLWLDDADATLKIKELATDADALAEGSFAADAGAPGAVVRERKTVFLVPPKPGHLPYYDLPPAVGAFLGVPVLDGPHLRGVLCADRLGQTTFGAREEQILQGAARQIVRAIQSERVFSAVERSKYEHERFFRAAEMLGKALTLQQVFETTFRAAREIVSFDFGAISFYDKEARRHTIQYVEGDAPPDLAGVSYSDNAGLAAMAIKNRHYLPASGEVKDKGTPVFKAKIKLKGMESLLVLPLICADEAIGTLTLAAEKRGAFPDDKREMLGVIATQVAFSVENAKMYRRMEQMATTDGLTGLLNHRTFQERFAEMLERAARHKKSLSLVLTDIDHFKRVNDTYGHPTGDAVLKRVAQVLAERARKIDVVARYGGEEFALVLEETDGDGARQLCERIRAEVQACQLESEKGPFHVTLSLGIATFPADGQDKKTLISHSDQCLYFAKEHGRNQAVSWPQVVKNRPSRPHAA